jgi:hypothetical protein
VSRDRNPKHFRDYKRSRYLVSLLGDLAREGAFPDPVRGPIARDFFRAIGPIAEHYIDLATSGQTLDQLRGADQLGDAPASEAVQ